MATGTKIRTYFNGQWHDEDLAIMRAADHGSWLGTTVFDGARFVHGLAPDLDAHCARINRSAEALMITPTVDAHDMAALCREGLRAYGPDDAVYIRPMYWALDGGNLGVNPKPNSTGFAICLEAIPMAPEGSAARLTTTQFRRPVLESAVVNAKAGCLYPNNARMLLEAQRKGFDNALVADAMGNVAETATANIFMVKDSTVYTPIPNGTFLAGITRARHMDNLERDGTPVVEKVLSFEDFHTADEVFMSGNMMKVTPVSAFDDTTYDTGANGNPVTRRVREMYWNWAKGAG